MSAHPPDEQLERFGLGRLPPEELERVERHVSDCESCCETLRRLQASDTLVDLLRSAARSPQSIADDVPNGETQTLNPAADESLSRSELDPALRDHPRYRVLGVLGRGGMGVVYKAQHRVMDRLLVLKVMRAGLIRDRGAVERFRVEVRAASRLHHPNIVTAYDAEQVGDCHFLAMEYVPGVSLDRLVAQEGRLPVSVACRIGRQIADGLEHAYRQGMVHRDIKPQNVLITRDGVVKILDFGLARFASERADSAELTADGSLLGTPDYMAPEQIDDPRQADIRADLYSLGCTLYYLLAARTPFVGGTAMQKLRAHLERTPEPIHSLRSDIPERLRIVLERLLAKRPEQRFATPDEVSRALAPFADDRADSRLVDRPAPDDRQAQFEQRVPVAVARDPASPTPAAPTATPLAAMPAVPLVAPERVTGASRRLAASPTRRPPSRPERRRAQIKREFFAIGAGAAAVLTILALLYLGVGRGRGRGDSPTPEPSPDPRSAPTIVDSSPTPSTPPLVVGSPRVLIVAPHRVWRPDFVPLREQLADAGVASDVVSNGNVLRDMETGAELGSPDVSWQQASAALDTYSAVIVVGGETEELARGQALAAPLVREFSQRGRLVAAICKGQQVLDAAGMLRGRPIAQLSRYNRGANGESLLSGVERAERVVRDGRLITACDDQDVSQFVAALATAIQESSPSP